MFKILVIFSDGNAQNENGDITDTSILQQTARSLKEDNNVKVIGVVIPNTEKASRIQQLKGIASKPDDVIDIKAMRVTSYNSIAALLAFRVKRLVGCLGKNVINRPLCNFAYIIISYPTSASEINRGYYTVARRYEFYVRVARTISHE